MRPCSRVGIDLSWRCSWNCKTCFYHFDSRLHKPIDKPAADVRRELDAAKQRGCDHAVAVGWGEPSLAPTIYEFLDHCRSRDLTSSIITNGTAVIERYQSFYDHGLDHLHVSVHGLGETLDRIAGLRKAAEKQAETLDWLRRAEYPWRSNTTLQQENKQELPAITQHLLAMGCRHVVLLGFLPHYAWNAPEKMRTVAVHPAELQPEVQRCIDMVLAAGQMVTLRYHPFCYLKPDYWRYVTNARYVLFDSFEWDYEHHHVDVDKVWPHAVQQGDSVAVQGAPCDQCVMRLHCGGWNRHYVKGLNVQLKPIKLEDVPAEHRDHVSERGHWHDLNPANRHPGYFGKP